MKGVRHNDTIFTVYRLLCITAGVLMSCLLICVGPAHAQDKAFARQMIDTLTSPYFSGRGYVDDGHIKAAHFISDKFSSYGLQKFQGLDGYLQHFPMTVNTFPGKVSLVIDGKKLTPGADFLVEAQSAGTKKKHYRLLWLDSLMRGNRSCYAGYKPKKTIIVATQALLDSLGIAVKTDPELGSFLYKYRASPLITLKDKLLWTVYAQGETGRTISTPNQVALQVKPEAIPAGAREAVLTIDEKFLTGYGSQNVCGYVKGKTYPDSFIFFTAHYDHLGRMGTNTYFPGANDNASGTAMLLDLARYYSRPENAPDYSIAFIAFSGEEAGLLGSRYFTEHPAVPLKNIAFLINMDLMANGQDGMMVVNGSVFPRAYHKMEALNTENHYLKELKQRGKAANSDHYWFSEKGVPAVFVYLLGDYPWYHDIYDTKEKPTLAGYEGAFHLLTDFVKKF